MSAAVPSTPLLPSTPHRVTPDLPNYKPPTKPPTKPTNFLYGREPTIAVTDFIACKRENITLKSEFVEGLVDTALLVIQSIWGGNSPDTASAENTRGLPLRVFIRETLRRSRTCYSTLQTALFYLFRVKAFRDLHAQTREATTRTNTGLGTTRTGKSIPKRSRDAAGTVATPPPTPTWISPSLSLSPCSLPSSSPRIPCPPSPELERPSKRVRRKERSTPDESSAAEEPVPPHFATKHIPDDPTQQRRYDDPVQCGRRMFLAALISAAKYLQDRNYSNRAWSKISGLTVEEINRNERTFLRLLDYRLFVSPPLFRRWSSLLVGHVHSLRKSTTDREGCLLAGGTSFSVRPSAAVVG